MIHTAYDWKVGERKIEDTQHNLQKLIDVADLIKQAEMQYENLISYSKSWICLEFPRLKEKSIRDAQSKKAAAIRLRKYFMNLLNETSI